MFFWNTAIHLHIIIIFIFFCLSSLEEDPLYIAYADMMAKVTRPPPQFDPLLSRNSAGSCLPFQSCAEGEEEEEGKEKTFEVRKLLLCISGFFFFFFKSLTVPSLMQEKEMEKQKMLYQQARLHDRGAAEMVLQMISASKGGQLHAAPPVLSSRAPFLSSVCLPTVIARSSRRHGDRHPQVRHFYPERGEHPGPAGTSPPRAARVGLHSSCLLSTQFGFFFFFAAENAGLPEGKTRRGLFQKSVWSDDVLQVVKSLRFVLSRKDAAVVQF